MLEYIYIYIQQRLYSFMKFILYLYYVKSFFFIFLYYFIYQKLALKEK